MKIEQEILANEKKNKYIKEKETFPEIELNNSSG